MTRIPLACAVAVVAFLLGLCLPTLAVVADMPVATATPVWAQEPPQPPQLSDEEQEAYDAKKAGKPLTEAQKDAAQRAEDKKNTAEKYQGKRNQQKQRGGPRRR